MVIGSAPSSRRSPDALAPGDPGRARRGAARWILAAAVAAHLGLGFLLFPASGVDDAHITFWSAWSLAERGVPGNYEFDAVEQSSSPWMVGWLALLRLATGLDVPTLGWLFGILGGVVGLWLTSRWAAAQGSARARFAPLLLALSHPFTYWAFSGMEAAWAGALAAGWMLALARASRREGALLKPALMLAGPTVAYLLVRPEALPIALATGLALAVLAARDPGARKAAGPAWLALATTGAALVGARLAYYGSALPQTVVSKSARPLSESAALGLGYLAAYPVPAAILGLAALLGAGLSLRALAGRPTRFALLAGGAFSLAQLGFLALSGGDWMEGGRFLAPAVPVALVLVLELVGRIAPPRGVALGLGLVLSGATLHFAATGSRSLTLWGEPLVAWEGGPPLSWCERKNKVHLRDHPATAALDRLVTELQPQLGRPLRVMTGQGGMILYHVATRHPGAMSVTDRRGLLDRKLLSSPTAREAGRGPLGLALDHGHLARNWNAIHQEAGIEPPDVVLDLNIDREDSRRLTRLGYEEVYRQEGVVRSKGELLPGREQNAGEAMFLHRSLARLLPEDWRRGFQFAPATPRPARKRPVARDAGGD